MNKFLNLRILLIIGTICIIGANSNAQILKINPKLSSMTILGTTNVHNFEINVSPISGELVINSAKKVESLAVIVPVKSLKSKESLMNTKTYEAFNEPKNPTISFKLIEANDLQVNANDVSVTVTGNLTMAGTTKKITFKTTGKSSKPGVYDFKGSLALKMSEYGMKPPTAMLGMMKVGDAVTLKFNVVMEGNLLSENK